MRFQIRYKHRHVRSTYELINLSHIKDKIIYIKFTLES